MSGNQQQWNGHHLGEGASIALGQILAKNDEQIHLLRSLNYRAEQTNDVLIFISEKIGSPPPTSTKGRSLRSMVTPMKELMEAVPPILKALLPVMLVWGLIVGKVTWADIPRVAEAVLGINR